MYFAKKHVFPNLIFGSVFPEILFYLYGLLYYGDTA